ncbi:MAG: hypothetical protein QOJ26_1662 [Thermoplasmata archaeon]|nr:hypothetical protein [Thermoplasmata archaeon]MEA3166788.1 hypothetical protein [Thermoplasmata archaeon]
MQRDRDPSWGALLLALLAVGLLALTFVTPWWSFDSSTGRKTADGGPQDPSDTRVEKHSLDYMPFRQTGDQQPSDAEGAKQGVLYLGIAAATAAGGMALFVLFEAFRFLRSFPRGLSLLVSVLAVLGCLAGLVLTYYVLPQTMRGDQVDGTFTDRLLDPGYIRTALGPGWVLAALATPLSLGALAFRYQAGSHDPTAIEAYA